MLKVAPASVRVPSVCMEMTPTSTIETMLVTRKCSIPEDAVCEEQDAAGYREQERDGDSHTQILWHVEGTYGSQVGMVGTAAPTTRALASDTTSVRRALHTI